MNIYDPIANALNLEPTITSEQLEKYAQESKSDWVKIEAWNKGKSMPEYQKKLISDSMTGRKRTIAEKKAISVGKLGKKRKPFSEEHKRKISETLKRKKIKPPVRNK